MSDEQGPGASLHCEQQTQTGRSLSLHSQFSLQRRVEGYQLRGNCGQVGSSMARESSRRPRHHSSLISHHVEMF